MNSEAGPSIRTLFSSLGGSTTGLYEEYPVPMDEGNKATIPGNAEGPTNFEDDGDVGLYFEGKRYDELSEEDMVGKEFKTVEEADIFYNRYAKAVGFSVRKGLMNTNKHNVVTRRRWLCGKEGKREDKWNHLQGRVRKPRPETRENCCACFLIKLSVKRGMYVIAEFQCYHSHELASPRHSAYLVSHRKVLVPDVAQANSMRQGCIRTSTCYEYMVDQAGGYVNVGFTMKDLHNKVARSRSGIVVEGDAEAALSYLNAKKGIDPGFYCKFKVDEEQRLAHLFWRDSESFYDYSCFSDVIMFDSTYKTNCYGKPLVLLVGMNNHRMNVVLASALICNETSETYCWVLQTFLDSMGGKMPISVFTDGDEAMRSAIQTIFPGVRHRLCSWHLLRNISDITNNPLLLSAFKECLYDHITEEEFEVKWKFILDSYDLHESKTMQSLYKKRRRWAQAFFRGHFLGDISSTQRCESMNNCMKAFIKKTCLKIHECVCLLDRGVLRVRNKCAMEDFRNMNSTPVLTTALRRIERHASKVFTEKVFYRVQDEINAVGALNVLPPITFSNYSSYKVLMYGKPGLYWTVNYFNEPDLCIKCSCDSLDSKGIPCRHIFGMMKWEGMMEIPTFVIMKRFTKDARQGTPMPAAEDTSFDDVVKAARYGALNAMCKKLSYVASHSSEAFDEVKHGVCLLTTKFEALGSNVEGGDDIGTTVGLKDNIIRDANNATLKVKDNGSQKKGKYKSRTKRQACSICRICGHTKTTCPQRPGGPKCKNVPYETGFNWRDSEGPCSEQSGWDNRSQSTLGGESHNLSAMDAYESFMTSMTCYETDGLTEKTVESRREQPSLTQQG